jgi:hypothetical protein
LLAEGIVEIGRAPGTSFLFVLTKKKLHVFHAEALPDRTLDGYAVQLAVTWIEGGLRSFEVAENLGVSQPTLRAALVQAGYERLTPSQNEQRTHARMARKLGNRSGRLVRVNDGTGA